MSEATLGKISIDNYPVISDLDLGTRDKGAGGSGMGWYGWRSGGCKGTFGTNLGSIDSHGRWGAKREGEMEGGEGEAAAGEGVCDEAAAGEFICLSYLGEKWMICWRAARQQAKDRNVQKVPEAAMKRSGQVVNGFKVLDPRGW